MTICHNNKRNREQWHTFKNPHSSAIQQNITNLLFPTKCSCTSGPPYQHTAKATPMLPSNRHGCITAMQCLASRLKCNNPEVTRSLPYFPFLESRPKLQEQLLCTKYSCSYTPLQSQVMLLQQIQPLQHILYKS